MTDAPEAPKPGAASDGEPAVAEHTLTTLLRSDAVTLMLAARTVEEGGGRPEALIAARRDLEAELRRLAPWPSGQDYTRAADDFDRMGRPGDAALLRSVAETDTLIADARAEWNTRYDGRAVTPATEMLDAMRESGMVDFDPSGPYPGVDGATYEPGALTAGGEAEPVLVVSGRGAAELVTGWAGFDAMAGWVASRGTTASGPLTAPPASGACRAWEEDQVLAHLVNSPRAAPHLVAGVPPVTFTTDVRYDLYQAIAALAADGCYYFPEQLEAELAARMARVPAHGAASYGGETGPFARAYLARLAGTEVSARTAADTALALVQEDQQHRARSAAPRRAPAPAAAADLTRRTLAPGLPVQQPRRPDPGPAPAQRP